MKHPFEKFFNTALERSTDTCNLVLQEAEKLKEKGYDSKEVFDVLVKFQRGLLDDKEDEIATEAVKEFSRYLD